MSEKQLTAKDVIREVYKLAELYPDKVYERLPVPVGSGCLYVHPTEEGFEPGCIVGVAVLALGVSADAIKEANYSRIELMFHKVGISYTTQEVEWLSFVQIKQDKGQTWGSAVADSGRLEENE